MIILCAVFGSAELTDGIVAFYSFEEDTGATVINSVIGGVNGTPSDTEPFRVVGRSGYALNQTGTNGKNVSLDNSICNFGLDNFTISAWYKYNGGLATENSAILGSQKIVPNYNGIMLDIQGVEASTAAEGTLRFYGTSISGTGLVLTCGYRNQFNITDVWTHAVVVRSGTNISLYVNGTYCNSTTSVSVLLFNNTASTCKIFSNGDQPTYSMNGAIDELGLWNRALSESEIALLYANPNPYNITANVTIPTSYNISLQKSPQDLNSSVVGLVKFNASVTNLTTNNSITDDSYAELYYNITTIFGVCAIFENQQCTDGSTHVVNMTKINNTFFNYSISERQVFPAYYPYYEEFIENADHYNYSVYLNHNIKFIIQNFTTYTNPYISLEMDTENNSRSSIMGIYYCNSSYNTGYPLLNENCELVQTVPTLTSFTRHCHNSKSCHVVMPINIQNVAKTQNSSIVVVSSQPTASGGYNVRYVLNSSYGNHSFKIGNYNTWSDTNYIFDMHIHQYIASDSFKYWSKFYDGSGNLNTSIFYTDFFDVINQPPSANYVYKPNETDKPTVTTSQNTSIFFAWTQSVDFENDTLTYNLTLRDYLGLTSYNIGVFNQTTFNYSWSTNADVISEGQYQAIIKVCDNNSNCAIGTSRGSINICENDWQKTIQPCAYDVREVIYEDVNDCDEQYDVPLNNGTYEDCISIVYNRPDWSDDQIILVICIVVAILSFLGAIFVHEAFFGLTALIFAVMLAVSVHYDHPTELIFVFTFFIIACAVMWGIIHKVRR